MNLLLSKTINHKPSCPSIGGWLSVASSTHSLDLLPGQ